MNVKTGATLRTRRLPMTNRGVCPMSIIPQLPTGMQVEPGMIFGNWEVISVDTREVSERIHGFPCHCCWGVHSTWQRPGQSEPWCSHENPNCPCYEVKTWTEYTVICRCNHDVVKTARQELLKPPAVIKAVSVHALLSGRSKSCGHCRCTPEHCARPYLFEAAESDAA